MSLPNVSAKLVGLERITRADIFNAPAERVIALGRLLLCALSTLAIQFEPTQPVQYAAYAELTLMVYLLFAAILVPSTRYRFLGPRTRAAIHFADVIFISVLLSLTDGPTSPFFVFFTFALLAATLRWQWQAVVTTAAALTGVLLIAGTKDNDLDTAIIRGAYLIVAGGMLAYVSAFYRLSRDRFAMLAPWPMRKADEVNNSSIPQLLAHSARVLEAPRILAIWDEGEEPYVNLIYWREGTFQETRRAACTFGDLVNPPPYSSIAPVCPAKTIGGACRVSASRWVVIRSDWQGGSSLSADRICGLANCGKLVPTQRSACLALIPQ